MNNQSMSAGSIKREAKGLLTNNWSRALSALCILLLAMGMFLLLDQFVISVLNTVMSFSRTEQETLPETLIELLKYTGSQQAKASMVITAIMSLFYVLIISPLNLGITSWYQSLAMCGDLKVNQVFYYYRTNGLFTGALGFSLMRVFRIGLILLLTLSPSAVCFALGVSYIDIGVSFEQRGMAMPLVAAAAALLLIGGIISIVVILGWFLAKYLYVAGKGYGINECFSLSRKYMKGKAGDILGLFFSCIPMWLSCIFVFPLLYAIPMTKTIFACAAQDIIDEFTHED